MIDGRLRLAWQEPLWAYLDRLVADVYWIAYRIIIATGKPKRCCFRHDVSSSYSFSCGLPFELYQLPIRTALYSNTCRRHFKNQDSSFFRQHRHRLTSTARAYDFNFAFDIWRATNAYKLLTYLLIASFNYLTVTNSSLRTSDSVF